MLSVDITASLGPSEIHAELTPFLGRVNISAMSLEALRLSKTDATETAFIQFLAAFVYTGASIWCHR